MNNKSMKGSWAAGFSIASVWFATHVGAGFATGNQILNYYVKYGWTAIIYPILAMSILGYAMYVIMKFCKLNNITNYKDAFQELWKPYPKLGVVFEIFYILIILAAISAAINGMALLMSDALGISVLLSTLIIIAGLLILSMFGVRLIIAASTWLSIAILITSGIIIFAGSYEHMPEIAMAFQEEPLNPVEASWKGIFIYAGFQCVSMPIVISASSILNVKGIRKAAILGGIMNGGMLALFGFMLLGYYHKIIELGQDALPNLFVCEVIGWKWLIIVYSILLFSAFTSTCVTLVYTSILRFEPKFVPRLIKSVNIRKIIVGIIIIGLCMNLSFLGISNIVIHMYSYAGYIGIFGIIIPIIIIGNIKNKRITNERNHEIDKNDE